MARILLVEDDLSSADILARLLRYSGHTVETVADGAAAIRSLEGSLPDVVLLDLMMPVLDGSQVLAHIRAEPQWRHLKVIMLTAVAHGPEAEKVRSLGISGYYIKGSLYFPELLKQLNTLSV